MLLVKEKNIRRTATVVVVAGASVESAGIVVEAFTISVVVDAAYGLTCLHKP